MQIVKNYSAENAIGAYCIAKPGTAVTQMKVAAANTDLLIGVNCSLAQAINERIDIIHFGYAEVKLGGTVAFGEYITSDASGYGVKLADTMLQSGAIQSVGIAMGSGVSGDIIPLLVLPQKVSKFDAVTSSAAELNVLDGIVATLTAAELSILDGVTATAAELNKLDGAPMAATFVIGAEAGNVINVGIQLQDGNAADLAVRGSVLAYLSDDANGDSIVATAPDGGWAIGTDGLLIPVVTNKAAHLISESDGDIDINVTHAAGAKTSYLILRLPNGKLLASTAITFA